MVFYYYLIILWVSILAPFTAHAEYQTQLELQFKYGNHRSLGRGHMLIPLWQQPNWLLFTHIMGLLDKDHHQEGNLGIGYRYQKHDYILGLYGYYDHRYSAHHHHFHQATLGFEYLTPCLETRLNGYWPFHATHPLSVQITGLPKFVGAHYQLAKLNHQVFEYAIGGLDTELGLKLPKAPIHLYIGYYYFKHQALPCLHGPRIRTQINLSPILSLSTECHYDRSRRFNYFLGFELKASLDASTISTYRLARKMIQPPIRDIDIIIQAGDQVIELDTQTATPIEHYVDLDKIRDNLNGHYIVTKDIIALGQKHSPLGSKEAPFTGIIVGVSNDKSQLQLRKIHGLNLESSQGKCGLFGYVDHACIGYLSTCHQPLKLVSNEQHNKNRGLHHDAIGSLVGEANTHNILIYNRNLSSCLISDYDHHDLYVGGLVGCMNKHNILMHNSNVGTLTVTGQNNHLGGITGRAWESNILAQNINLGTITLYQAKPWAQHAINHGGGIIGQAYINNLLTYNTNAGRLIESGERDCKIGGIAGSIGSGNSCTHNVNLASLNGTKLGGIVSQVSKQNKLSYNFNAGPLIARAHSSNMGGILESAEENNMISYNANSGKISGKDAAIGGIIANAYINNIISYNINIGELSGHKESMVNMIGGIAVSLRAHNTLINNMNAGTIFVDPATAGPPEDPNMERYNTIGGIVSYLCNERNNSITHNVNTGAIVVNQISTDNYIGGIIGLDRELSNTIFENNIYNATLISYSPTTEQRLKANSYLDLGGQQPFIDLVDSPTLSYWAFGLTQDWLLSAKGPSLTWVLKNRALTLLKQLNRLKIIHAHGYLPSEMLLEIAGIFDDFQYLNFEQIKRICHYALTPAHLLVEASSKAKYHWSENDYLIYVIKNQL